MNKLIICGPTATGKTKLGLELANKFNGEIVSADSRQIYKNMNIGTGKDLPENSNIKYQISKQKLKTINFNLGYYLVEKIPVWLLDIVNPDYKFNVSDYKQCADAVIENIVKRGKLPIIVGGTGFYIKAITENIETIGIPQNDELRKELSNYPISQLQIMLEKIDPKRSRRMNESDRQNPRRLVRAIEVASQYQISNIKDQNQNQNQNQNPEIKDNNLFIGLTAPNEVLYKRIDQRVEQRIKDGIENEIKSLLNKGYNWENSALGTTIAYKEWKEYIIGVGAQRDAPVQIWKFDEHNYSRRQITWFKKQKNINWFDISEKNYATKVEKSVENWLVLPEPSVAKNG